MKIQRELCLMWQDNMDFPVMKLTGLLQKITKSMRLNSAPGSSEDILFFPPVQQEAGAAAHQAADDM